MLGKNIAKYRKQKKISQSALGEMFNVTQGAVSQWERGVTAPDIPTIKEIAKVLGVSFSDLVGDDETLSPKEVPWGPIKENPRPLMLDGDPVMGWADDRPETQAVARELYSMALDIGATKEDVDAFRNYLLLTKGQQHYINNSMKFLRSQRKEEEGT